MEFCVRSPQVIGGVNEVESRNGHYLNGEFCRRRAACDAIKNRRRRLSPIDLLFLAVKEGRGGGSPWL